MDCVFVSDGVKVLLGERLAIDSDAVEVSDVSNVEVMETTNDNVSLRVCVGNGMPCRMDAILLLLDTEKVRVNVRCEVIDSFVFVELPCDAVMSEVKVKEISRVLVPVATGDLLKVGVRVTLHVLPWYAARQ